MNEIVVIIPTYDERGNIERMAELVLGQPLPLSLLIVDDGSPDGTGDIADAMAAADDRIQVLHRAGKQGLGTAYIAGFRYALARGAEYCCEIDADFSHNPDDLPRLVEAARQADVAIGSRYVKGGGFENWSTFRWMKAGEETSTPSWWRGQRRWTPPRDSVAIRAGCWKR
jgi:dolichol-phosphate mannosyltransferase